MIKLKNPTPKKKENQIKDYEYPITTKEFLVRHFQNRNANFFNVIINRKSTRIFNEISLNDISEVLWYSSKVISLKVEPSGFVWSHRPSPSAGGRHPIDILISLPGNRERLYLYNPIEHSINLLTVSKSLLKGLISHSDRNLKSGKSTIFWFIAHYERTSSKYNNPESLIWRDAGALLYCIQICAEALGLNSCALGINGEPYLSKMFSKQNNKFGVGGLMLG